MICQGEMVNTSADDVDTMVDNKPTVLPEQANETCEQTPRPHPPAAAVQPQTLEPRPLSQTPETDPLSGWALLWLMMLKIPRPGVPTLQDAKAAENTSDVDVDQQVLSALAGGNSLPDVPLPDIPHLNVPLPEAIPDG